MLFGKKKSNTNKTEKKNKYVNYIAIKNNIPYEQAKLMMDEAREKYAEYELTYTGYTNCKLDEKNEADQLKAVQEAAEKRNIKREHAIEHLMEVTGQTREEVQARLDYVKEHYNLSSKQYYNRLYYNLTDEEIKEDIKKRKEVAKGYVQTCVERSGKTADEIEAHMIHVAANYKIDSHDYLLFRAWELSDAELDSYLTLKHSKIMQENYDEENVRAYAADKILFNKEFKDYVNRKFWVNEDTSYEEFCEFTDGLEYIFIKPINLCQGRGARKIVLSEVKDLKALYNQLMEEPKLLVEEGVIQHSIMNAVHPNSINTIRIIDLQQGDECITIAAFVRFGMHGSVVDNMVAGGSIAGVNEKTGVIETPIVDREGNAYEVHPDTGIRVLGMQIPMWDEILEMTEKALRHIDGLNYLGFDVALTENGPVIIEANTLPGLEAYQVGYAQAKEGKLYKFEKYL